MVYKMLHHGIILISLVPQILTKTYHTQYRQTAGEAQSGIIRFLVSASLDFDSVGVRIPSDNKEAYELLSHTWMENREYENGFSYFEKFDVDVKQINEEEQIVAEEDNNYIWKVPGPLAIGSKLTVALLLLYPDKEQVDINLVDNRYPDVILHHVTVGSHLTYDKFDGNWANQGIHYANFWRQNDVIVLVMEIGPNSIQASMNGLYPSIILQVPPGDTTTWLRFNPRIEIHRIRYVRK